jgi:hypothetical protein
MCILLDWYIRFGGTYCLLQGTLNKERVRFFEKLVPICQTPWRHDPANHIKYRLIIVPLLTCLSVKLESYWGKIIEGNTFPRGASGMWMAKGTWQRVRDLYCSTWTCDRGTRVLRFGEKQCKRPFGRPRRRREDNAIKILDNWTLQDLGLDTEENIKYMSYMISYRLMT